MNPRIPVVLVCALIAACANEDISVTGISRECAIAIAEGSCSGYPQRYSYVERAAWLNRPRCWEVNLTDENGRGKSYRINSHHKVISVVQIGSTVPVKTVSRYPVPRDQTQTGRQPLYSAPAQDYSDREFYFRDGDYYERPRQQHPPPKEW